MHCKLDFERMACYMGYERLKFQSLEKYFVGLCPHDVYDVYEQTFVELVECREKLRMHVFVKKYLMEYLRTCTPPECDDYDTHCADNRVQIKTL